MPAIMHATRDITRVGIDGGLAGGQNAAGGIIVHAAECDTRLVVKARVFVDSRTSVLNEAGEILMPIEEGRIDAGVLPTACHSGGSAYGIMMTGAISDPIDTRSCCGSLALESGGHTMSTNDQRLVVCSMSVLLLAGCIPPKPPPANGQSDTASTPPAVSQDTYFEGSRRVWEAARDRGVVFRAVGQEPGWVLEIEDSRITLETNHGADKVVTPVPEPVVEGTSRTTTWHAVTEANDLRIESREEPCADPMSGERFAMTVTVTLNGTTFDGCGRMLDSLP